MGFEPWSTTVELSWKPNLRYFQQRYELLSDVESLTGVRSYDLNGPSVGARLESPGWAEVQLSPDGLALHRRLPEGGWSELLLAARLVLGALGPGTPVRVEIFNQYLIELPDLSYEEARQVAGERMTGTWAQEIGLTDWAILFDGRDAGASYQVEFGILTRSEVPGRLGRAAGRSTGPGLDLRRLLRELEPDDVPEVAFFADFTWMEAPATEGQDLTDHCVDLIDRSTAIVSKLFKRATTARAETSANHGVG